MSYEVGSVLPFEFSVYDAAGALTNASTAVITVTLPDGTTSTPSVANASTGVYTSDVAASMAGLWSATIATTVPTDVSPAQVFYVSSLAATIPIVSEAEAQAYVRVTNSTQVELLRRMLVAATNAVERYTDRSWRRKSVVEYYDGGFSEIVLRSSPVRSVTSVVESGTTLAATDYVLRNEAAVLVRGSSTSPSTWQFGVNNVAVTYVVGPQEIPENVRHAVLVTVREMWTSQRGGGDLPDGGAIDYAEASDLIPREARLLLEPHRRAGIA